MKVLATVDGSAKYVTQSAKKTRDGSATKVDNRL
tara:strand:+ start:529 stop:630 length:102 start_codon:yes stop_codon:yes gene_type:complete